MSSAATPTRVGRNVLMPGIDTRVAYEQQNAVMSYAGLHTPPQSAHDSRRPSCAYTSLSEGSFSGASTGSFSGASSLNNCSQPPTPVHDVHQVSPHFPQKWSEAVQTGVNVAPAHVRQPCTTGPSMDALFQAPAFSHPAIYNAGDVGATNYASAYQHNGMDAFGMHMSDESSMRDSEWAGHELNLLKSTLMAMSNGMPPDAEACASLYQHSAPLHHSPEAAMLANYQLGGGSTVSASIFQPSQVVMPMSVGPQDHCSMASMAPQTHISHPSLSCSFDSTSTGCSNWDLPESTSPTNVCFSPSEEELATIKHEEPMTPSHGSSVSPRRDSAPNSATRVRRPSRRPRKSHASGRPWLQFNNYDFEISFEGKRFVRDANGQIIPEETRDPKPHRCQHQDDDGVPCGRRFERSEHLKRHMGMHTKERKYPCPLPGCGKRIGRPDNAGDHFKTHLRLPKKGKRNKHFEMAFVEECITAKYPEKQAEKMLTNLKKWKIGEDERVRQEEERARVEEELRRYEH